jgi:stage V sporulation protein R
MELINQHTKGIMEACKERARAAGLRFHDETLEYVVTNKDLLELSPKAMIPTLYDYWVHDVEVLKGKGRYELYPHNPYETVINTRPAISFYNDNNPDWLNVMIFYHVLGHIDFFQNNHLYRHTWDEDFAGQALSDKRFISMLRSEKGRWVDYVIEFTRSIDNLVGYFQELSDSDSAAEGGGRNRLDFYFDVFLQSVRKEKITGYMREIDRYNTNVRQHGEMAESMFFADVARRYPEFDAHFDRHRRESRPAPRDLVQVLEQKSPFLQREENRWMKPVMQIVRKTSLFFQPQIRTKIMNEGWASYWHDKLFRDDERIRGHEVDYARVNAWVTSLPRVGINPYALGMRLFEFVEEKANKGQLSYAFERIRSTRERSDFDTQEGRGPEHIFMVRELYSDFLFINTFIDQDFVDRHKLFVVGKRMNSAKGVWEYFVQSRAAEAYRAMLLESLYHPPHIRVDSEKTTEEGIYLAHEFEGKPLVKEYIGNTMLGISYLWGGSVKLETTERVPAARPESVPAIYGYAAPQPPAQREPTYRRVVYEMADRKLSKSILE